MKYIKQYDNFKPIKVNNAKPFKVKKNLAKSIQFLQQRIKSLRRRLQDQDSLKKRSEMNREISNKIQKLSDLTRYQIKQADYLKNNPVIESVQNDESIDVVDTKQKYNTLLELLESKTFEPSDILNYIGIDEKDYEIQQEYDYRNGYSDRVYHKGFTMNTKFETVEYIMNIENDVFEYLLSYQSSYGAPEYYVDNDDLNYLYSYTNAEINEKIKKLADIFDIEINIDEEGEIVKLFENLGLYSELDDFKVEISYENQNAIKEAVNALFKSIPFEIDHCYNNSNRNKNFNCELIFDYDDMIEFIKEKNKTDVSTIEEFLDLVSSSFNIGYDIEEEKYDYLGNFDDLKKEINNIVDKYIESPDDIFIKLIEHNKLDVFKNKTDLAFFDYVYDFNFKYDRKRGNLVDIAILYDNSITKWMCTDEFKVILKEKVLNVTYNNLTDKLFDYETEGVAGIYNL